MSSRVLLPCGHNQGHAPQLPSGHLRSSKRFNKHHRVPALPCWEVLLTGWDLSSHRYRAGSFGGHRRPWEAVGLSRVGMSGGKVSIRTLSWNSQCVGWTMVCVLTASRDDGNDGCQHGTPSSSQGSGLRLVLERFSGVVTSYTLGSCPSLHPSLRHTCREIATHFTLFLRTLESLSHAPGMLN